MTTAIADFGAQETERLDRFPTDVRPLSAAAAMMKFMRDKEDTSQVFRVFDYLDGPQSEKNFQQFAATEEGRRMIRENADLAPILCDRAFLKSLAPETLGGQYFQFTEREKIDAGGLIEAEKKANARSLYLEPGRRVFISTGYQLHDIWHVFAGYGRDLVGESAVLAFTYGQLKIRGIHLFGKLMGLKEKLHNPDVPVFAIQKEAERLGREADWLLAQDWKGLLATPIDEARAKLGVGTPHLYNQHKDKLQKRDAVRRTRMGYTAAF